MHPALPHATAEALGVRSLRYHANQQACGVGTWGQGWHACGGVYEDQGGSRANQQVHGVWGLSAGKIPHRCMANGDVGVTRGDRSRGC